MAANIAVVDITSVLSRYQPLQDKIKQISTLKFAAAQSLSVEVSIFDGVLRSKVKGIVRDLAAERGIDLVLQVDDTVISYSQNLSDDALARLNAQ